MAANKFFSSSKEFLQGIEAGIEFTNDPALQSRGISMNEPYGHVLTVSDSDSVKNINKYYIGSRLNDEEVA